VGDIYLDHGEMALSLQDHVGMMKSHRIKLPAGAAPICEKSIITDLFACLDSEINLSEYGFQATPGPCVNPFQVASLGATAPLVNHKAPTVAPIAKTARSVIFPFLTGWFPRF
jgi:hypothetical protein